MIICHLCSITLSKNFIELDSGYSYRDYYCSNHNQYAWNSHVRVCVSSDSNEIISYKFYYENYKITSDTSETKFFSNKNNYKYPLFCLGGHMPIQIKNNFLDILPIFNKLKIYLILG